MSMEGEAARTLTFFDIKKKEEQMTTLEQNLEKELFDLPLDFASLTPEKLDQHFQSIEKLYKLTHEKIASIISHPEKLSYDTVVQPLINLEFFVAKARALCSFTKNVHTKSEVRTKSADSSSALSRMEIEYALNEPVYKVFDLYEKSAYLAEKEKLNAEQKRFFETKMKKFRRDGLHLEDKKSKNEIATLQKRISDLSEEIINTIREDKTHFIFTAKELEGLPKSWFDCHQEVEPGSQKFKVTLEYPDVFPILEYAKDPELRKKIHLAFQTRGEKENLPKLKEIFILRQRLAKLVGYETYADYATEFKISKNGKFVGDFLKEMIEGFEPILDKNLKTLTEFASEYEKKPVKLALDNIRYYMRLHKENTFNLDMEKIKEYFPSQRTIEATLSVYQKLLGLTFKEVTNQADASKHRWHPEVQTFEVYENDPKSPYKNRPIGVFHLDLFPREGKYGHAAVFEWVKGGDISAITQKEGDRRWPECAMVCNFSPKDGFTFDEVVTFFHEFGHVMHSICSKTFLPQHHAFAVEDDFVEAPSQMLENWCYEPKVLELLSQHPTTKKPLPIEDVQKMKDLEKLHVGYLKRRQLVYGYFDYHCHNLSEDELNKLDIKKFVNDLQKELLKIEVDPNECVAASFTHIVGGYDVGYYGYMLSDTYSIDMYHTLFKKDPLSSEMGHRYRKCILEPGGSKDGMELLMDLLGRPPQMDAFLEECGLQKPIKKVLSGELTK